MSGDHSFPPEPWHLGGTMHVSLWRVPAEALPAALHAALPHGTSPRMLGGTALVGTAFVRYEPGGVLAYDELLVATLVRHRRRSAVTISDIWVDSPASIAGGRALWGIPKRAARFERAPDGDGGTRIHAHEDGASLAELHVEPGTALPGWRRIPLTTAQRLDGTETTSRVQALARTRLARATWSFPRTSPLAWLASERPTVSAILEPFSIAFGSAGGSRRRRTPTRTSA